MYLADGGLGDRFYPCFNFNVTIFWLPLLIATTPTMMTMNSAANLVNMKKFCNEVVTFMLKQLSQVRKQMQQPAMMMRALWGMTHSVSAGKRGCTK